MGILQGSKADDLTPQQILSIPLNSTFNITGAVNVDFTVPNFALILTIPALYYVTAVIRGQIEVATGIDGFIASCLQTTPLAGGTPTKLIISCAISGQIGVINQFADSSSVSTALIKITEPTKIEVVVRRKGLFVTPTFTTSQITDDANGGSSLTAIQMIN